VEILGDVATQYIVLFEELNKRVIATVTTAIPLDAALETKVIAKAVELAGKEVAAKTG
jgi:F-type H+-transporting ATPase subunit delta